jgi:oligosaccharyltransferase complex subunit alpha (ribophorin I)
MLWINAVKAFVNTKVQTTVTVTSNSINTAMVIHVQGTGDYLLPEAYTIKYNNVDIYPKTREINNTVYHVIPAKDKSFVLKVLDHSDVPEPFPKNIAQTDKSTFLASANAQLKSPYQSLVQETVIKVAGTIKRSNSPHLAKTTQNSLSFSFDQVPPNSEFLSVIHYEATSPCLIFNSYEKSVEISHWFSKLLFVEHFDIQNCGPKVENFNRILYMANPGKGSVVNELVARLPPAASDIYYKDTIGNVSTSRVFIDSKSTRLALRPRYPLFGGMRYSWFHGYSALFDQFLKTLDSGRFQLFVPVAPSVASIPARQYKLKIMLPEQAFDIEINNSVDMNTQESTSYSYFDTTGKPTITFSSDAFYPDNVGVVAVTYSLPPFWKFRKPAVIASAVLCAMAALWLLTNLQFSLSVVSYFYPE